MSILPSISRKSLRGRRPFAGRSTVWSRPHQLYIVLYEAASTTTIGLRIGDGATKCDGSGDT